jgi:hypothetical protein
MQEFGYSRSSLDDKAENLSPYFWLFCFSGYRLPLLDPQLLGGDYFILYLI